MRALEGRRDRAALVRPRTGLGVAFTCVLLGGAAWADDAAPLPAPAPEQLPAPLLHPFFVWQAQVSAGAPIRAPGLVLVPLLRAPEVQEVVEDARVGMQDAFVDIMNLPQPAGDLYVRMTNRGTLPVEVTVGEALVTPDGPARILLRGAYLPPGGSAFVPTARGLAEQPRGPYVTRGLGLSPREQALLETNRWPDELSARNAHFGVDAARTLDASAAYLTENFQVLAAPYEPRFEALRTARCVGVAAFDERGLAFARLCPDAARFQRNLEFLERELILDALRAMAAGRAPRDSGDAFLKAEVREMFAVLLADGVARQGFAGAALHRWEVPGRNARWEGLSVGGSPWSLTWRMGPPPPPAAAQNPGTPPTPPQPPPPTDDDATNNEIDRKARPTIEEERRAERTNPGGGGGAGGGGPGGAGGAGGGLR